MIASPATNLFNDLQATVERIRYCLGTGKRAAFRYGGSKNCPRLNWWRRDVKTLVRFRGFRFQNDSLVISLLACCFAKRKVWPSEAKVAIAVFAGVLRPRRFGGSKQKID